jgi:uncharacterized protein
MSQSKEPSMEEILSSIKRIIAEENDVPPRRPEPQPADEPDVLELTQEFGEPETMASFEPVEEPIAAEEAPALATAPVAPTTPAAAARKEADALLSSATADATRHALASLSRMVVKPEDPAADNTLEGLVRELLRPMLKDWLDANLPGIVQATVDREVARIAGRTL